ncbi:MAG: transcriptional regulator [Spirochaetaceae bacterium]|nr:MAG: transcriptional regulator [Spirochaetaceae bacterium]
MNSNTGEELKALDQIAGILAKIEDRRLIREFLICILTKYEIKEIAGRWELVKLLNDGMSQRKIAEQLGMSLCKITRGSKELKKRGSAFKTVLDGYVEHDAQKQPKGN